MAKFPCDLDPARRARLIAALQESYTRYDPAAFERDTNGDYPKLGEGVAQAVLDWIYPALHLTLEPRRGREAADRELARKMILRAIRHGQLRKDGDEADGIWYWSITDGEDPVPRDRNTAGFMGCGLVRIWANDPRKLGDWPAEDLALFKDAVRRSAQFGIRHWVRVGYINPQCLDFYLSWVAADLLGEAHHREDARPYLHEFLAHAKTTDSFDEWISPTYVAVNLSGLVPLAHYTQGGADEKLFRELLEFQWRLIGAAAHGPTREICGPHARAYGDTAFERAEHAYAWLHLAAPEVFEFDDPAISLERRGFYDWFMKRPKAFAGPAAPGLYVPLGVPEDVKAQLRARFERPEEGHECFEWIGRSGWRPPYNLAKPREPAPRFRLGTRFRADRFCLGSCNELDGWLQRRPCLAYWQDAEGATTGLKFHAVVRPDEASLKQTGEWLFMEAFEFVSAQAEAEVIGAYRMATVVPAKPGSVLGTPARPMAVGRTEALEPRDPVGWFLGTHWRQSIEKEWQMQRAAFAWVGLTPVGKGTWRRLDAAATRWAFAENGLEAVVEAPRGACLVRKPHLTRNPEEEATCLQLWSATDVVWDWMALPALFAPFGLQVQKEGAAPRFGLKVDGTGEAFELARGPLRLKWQAPSEPDQIEKRTWWAWREGEEILPPGYGS